MGKDEEKEEEIEDTRENLKDIFISKESRYRAVTISKKVGKEKIPAWFLDKNEQGKYKKEHNLVPMQMISGLAHEVYKLGNVEKVIVSKGRNVFKIKEAVNLCLPAEITDEFVCDFVRLNNGIVSIKILLYMEFGKSKSFRNVKKKIFTHLQRDKMFFHLFEGSVKHFNFVKTGFLVTFTPTPLMSRSYVSMLISILFLVLFITKRHTNWKSKNITYQNIYQEFRFIGNVQRLILIIDEGEY